jgi:hypothetical protein
MIDRALENDIQFLVEDMLIDIPKKKRLVYRDKFIPLFKKLQANLEETGLDNKALIKENKALKDRIEACKQMNESNIILNNKLVKRNARFKKQLKIYN